MKISIALHCIVCRQGIPLERIVKGASTCSKDCKIMLKKIRRAVVDERRCRFCHRPSTVDERRAWLNFRRNSPEMPAKRRGRAPKPAHPVQAAP